MVHLGLDFDPFPTLGGNLSGQRFQLFIDQPSEQGRVDNVGAFFVFREKITFDDSGFAFVRQ